MPLTTLYRPAEGRRALKPDGMPLAAAGEAIALDRYWRRLLAAGDIEAVPVSKTQTKSRSKTASGEGSPSA
ncbi:DUF2635 domain-containing protein [Novosphingobium naphthalenivorans]|uniref:DUF2635 domain-containing protein n=1 Tax=Novosphingobium naphthalenivorans TaxID=273168 RepID=UPI000836B79A|nr:DUF2635 domain-containing protein [Novosphingobium naphthalenivorans]